MLVNYDNSPVCRSKEAPRVVRTVQWPTRVSVCSPETNCTCWMCFPDQTPHTPLGWISPAHLYTLHKLHPDSHRVFLFMCVLIMAKQSLQSDTPYRRSFTGIDSIGQGRTGRASAGVGGCIQTHMEHTDEHYNSRNCPIDCIWVCECRFSGNWCDWNQFGHQQLLLHRLIFPSSPWPLPHRAWGGARCKSSAPRSVRISFNELFCLIFKFKVKK